MRPTTARGRGRRGVARPPCGRVRGSRRAGGSSPVPASGSGLPPSGSSLAAAGDRRMRFRKPLASSTWLVWWRSSAWVMWPITAMCALVARAGAVRVRIASGRESQAERSVGESVEISRVALLSTLANSGSITSSRGSLCRGLGRSGRARPDQALAGGEAGQGPRLSRGRRWRAAADVVPGRALRALALSPTRIMNSLG